MELAYCHLWGAQNFEPADRFLEKAYSDVGIQRDVRAPDLHREPQKICYLGEGTNSRLLLEFSLFLQTFKFK
jgi:hypothetical protein